MKAIPTTKLVFCYKETLKFMQKKIFNKIYIEISNICNLACTFCPEVEREKKVMKADFFQQLLPEVNPLCEQITLHLMGEPLAHPEFKKIVHICQEQDAKVNLTTNGILLEKYKNDLLSPCFRQINFSIQSFKDNFPLGDIEKYLNSIFEFSKRAMEVRPDLYINYRLWNLLETNDNANELNQYVIDYFSNKFEKHINPNVDSNLIKSKHITSRIYFHFDTRFEWPSLNAPFVSCQGSCYGGVNQLAIHADGTVVPCCLDKEAKINLGRWPQQSLMDIINSQRAQELVSGFKSKKVVETLCQHCSFRTRFDKKMLKHPKGENLHL